MLVHQRVGLNHQPVMETSKSMGHGSLHGFHRSKPYEKKRHGIPRNPIESYDNSH